MAYSWQEQIKPSGTQDIQCDIEYLDKSYIHVYLDGVETTGYTWTSSTNIRLNTALTADTTVLLIRKTEREYLYIEFASGSPFIEVNVDSQNTQFLHLAQELVEGRAIPGFYGDISMNGFRITNLGAGINPGDAVNKGQLDSVHNELDTRITATDNRVSDLANSFITIPGIAYNFSVLTDSSTDVIVPGMQFTKASVFINGVRQTPGYSFEVVDNTIMLADAVPAGTHVTGTLGEATPDSPDGYATAASVSALTTSVNTDIAQTRGSITALDARVTSLENSGPVETAAGGNYNITLIAHRGFGGLFPENTMYAFRNARRYGADMLECDIAVTSDGEYVIMHDETVDRTTNGTGNITQLTTAYVRGLDAAKLYPKLAGEQVPLFSEVLQYCRDFKMPVHAEFTHVRTVADVDGIVQAAIDANALQYVTFDAFDFERIERARAYNSDVKLSWLRQFGVTPTDSELDALAALGHATLITDVSVVTTSLVQKCKSRGIGLAAYTTNKIPQVETYRKLGLEQMLSDYPLKSRGPNATLL